MSTSEAALERRLPFAIYWKNFSEGLPEQYRGKIQHVMPFGVSLDVHRFQDPRVDYISEPIYLDALVANSKGALEDKIREMVKGTDIDVVLMEKPRVEYGNIDVNTRGPEYVVKEGTKRMEQYYLKWKGFNLPIWPLKVEVVEPKVTATNPKMTYSITTNGVAFKITGDIDTKFAITPPRK